MRAGDPAAMAAAAAAAVMRPVAPPPGGKRAVQSARPITRNGPAPDPSVWQGFIAQQVRGVLGSACLSMWVHGPVGLWWRAYLICGPCAWAGQPPHACDVQP